VNASQGNQLALFGLLRSDPDLEPKLRREFREFTRTIGFPELASISAIRVKVVSLFGLLRLNPNFERYCASQIRA
jgi:hypothetical protein